MTGQELSQALRLLPPERCQLDVGAARVPAEPGPLRLAMPDQPDIPEAVFRVFHFTPS